MGTICILLGILLLLAFAGGGFVLANELIAVMTTKEVMGQNLLTFVGMSADSVGSLYVVIVGICAFVGLLICLSLVMNGLIYNRVCKNGAALRRSHH